ncbi:MAG TPA: hypothetical protein VF550_18805 [Polyangia bacterium]
MTRLNALLLVWLTLALTTACRTGPMSASVRDAARDDTAAAGGRLTISIPGMGGAAGATLDVSEEQPSDCLFGSLLGEMVDQAAVIGYCRPVAVCDTAASSTDAGTASCSPVFDLGQDTLAFEHGTLVIKGPYSNTGCAALVFDAEGRLVAGRVNIPAWSDCRWPNYAGKSYYYYCVSE